MKILILLIIFYLFYYYYLMILIIYASLNLIDFINLTLLVDLNYFIELFFILYY
jgi:hypothetical protein